jgi:integrase
MNLTSKAVAGLALPAGKNDEIHFDDQLPGFGYRLRRRGSTEPVRSTWIAQYRHAGATRRVKIGDAAVLNAEAARSAARKVLATVALGQDPQGERQERRTKDALSFSSVVAEYLQAKGQEVRASTLAPIRRYLTSSYFKQLHGKAIDTITRKDIASRLVAIVRDNGSMSARQARAAINAFFVWAMQMGLVENNPVIGAVKPKDNASRERALSDAELGAVWRASGDDDYGRAVKLLILTGCRRQEIGGVRWSELDTDKGTWTLPAERSKNGKAHTLPLPPAAWDIINSVPHMASRDQLFGVIAGRGFTAWAQGKAGLDRRLGDAVAPFQLHDLRRSTATRMADLGIQPHIIEQILNHQSGHKRGPAGIYNRSSYVREVKSALATWADHVGSIVAGGERKIVPFVPLTPAAAEHS